MTTIRPARELEAGQIRDLIYLVGINPMGLDWKRFVVAVNELDEMIGCGQLKPHGQEILELASIAVYPEHQGKGVARAIIEHLLKDSPRPLYLMCQLPRTFLREIWLSRDFLRRDAALFSTHQQTGRVGYNAGTEGRAPAYYEVAVKLLKCKI
jgi:GNAT superfamily N-acetyltransferase